MIEHIHVRLASLSFHFALIIILNHQRIRLTETLYNNILDCLLQHGGIKAIAFQYLRSLLREDFFREVYIDVQRLLGRQSQPAQQDRNESAFKVSAASFT
jgi:hypothetical protein